MPVSYKMECKVGREWGTNNCAYATEAEAVEAGKELLSRWYGVSDSRAVPSEQPVNYRFNFDRYKPEMLPDPTKVVGLEVPKEVAA